MIVRFLCKLQNKSDACSRGCSVFILILRQKAASNAQIHIKSINMFRFQGFTFRHPCAMMYVVEDGFLSHLSPDIPNIQVFPC